MKRWIVAVIIVVCGLWGYARYVEPNLLTVRNYTWNEPTHTITVAQITDTHVGEWYAAGQLQQLVERVNELEPDIIVFTGDLFDVGIPSVECVTEVVGALQKLRAPYGKFAVYGNRDYGGGMIRHYEAILESSDFTLLVNEGVTIQKGERQLNLFGFDDAIWGEIDVEAYANFQRKDGTHLTLLHEPDAVEQITFTRPTLVLSGHSHGGQLSLPVVGALYKTKLAERYVSGQYNLPNDSVLSVHTGIGNTKLPYRFGNVPHIALWQV
ncbi:MAG: metallophosphoesterase [Bacilli bacterium]